MIGIKTLDEAGKILQDYSYEYDILGNQRIAVEDGKKTSYFYDLMNRLKEVVGENQKESYIYDPVGNRIQRESNKKISRYFYDKKSRLKRILNVKNLHIQNKLERNFVFLGSSILAELDEKLNLQIPKATDIQLIGGKK